MKHLVCAALAMTMTVLASQWVHAREPGDKEVIETPLGQFLIATDENYEQSLSFDGKEIAKDFVVLLDKTAQIVETDLVIFFVGQGGNACGPNIVLAWKTDDVFKSEFLEVSCDTPDIAVGEYGLTFVPYLAPGADPVPLIGWTPDEGVRQFGEASFSPDPKFNWGTLKPESGARPLDVLNIPDIYAKIAKASGDDLEAFALGLSVSSGLAPAEGDLIWGRGCEPHNCGGQDSLMVLDPSQKQVFIAKVFSDRGLVTWPDRRSWPKPAEKLLATFEAYP